MRHCVTKFFVGLVLCVSTTFGASPLRVDFSALTGRSDAETFRWQEWEVGEEQTSTQEFGGVKITLSTVGKKPLEGFLHKAALAKGSTTVSADGVRSNGAIELEINGLAPGEHTIATFHNWPPRSPTGPLTVSCGDATVEVTPTVDCAHDDEAANALLTFTAEAGRPVVVRIAGTDDRTPVVLNGFELDAPRPDMKALRPTPGDFDEHVAGEAGEVKLAWRRAKSAVKYRVWLGHDRDWNTAFARIGSAESPAEDLGETSGQEISVKVAPHDSLMHYCWRVDSIAADGTVTRGDVWSFRVRRLAFPGAEGYGRFAIGGRGGKVVKVTTLADDGPGSLRAALAESGARIVVFDVSGRIDLKSRLGIRDDYLTIAGQTAPGNGICISNYNLGMLGSHDVIVRYVRVRPGNTSGETLDGMGMASSDHSIIDHCSISWTHDEAFSSRGAKNITLQRTLISEALNIAGHRKYEKGKQHGFAASIGGDVGSFHHNLLAHCAGRNWSLAGSIDQANIHAGRLDIRNNVVFNWGHRTTDGGAKQVQFVNNYYKPGPATQVFHVLMPERNHAFGPQDYFVAGNVMEGKYGADETLAGVIVPPDEPLAKFVYPQPFYESFVNTQSAEEAYEDVLADVGCNLPALDKHDQRVIEEVRTGRVKFKGSVSGIPGLPDSQADVGGWDEYPEVHRAADWDLDGDGMPSAWEQEHGFDPADSADGPQDADGDGVTNVEEYLNGLVATHD